MRDEHKIIADLINQLETDEEKLEAIKFLRKNFR